MCSYPFEIMVLVVGPCIGCVVLGQICITTSKLQFPFNSLELTVTSEGLIPAVNGCAKMQFSPT